MRDKALRDAREEQQELEALHRLDEECVHQQRAGNYLKAFDCMERALVLRRHFFGIESEEVIQACRALAEMCNLLAMSFLQQDNYTVTIDLLKKAEVLTQRHHPVERATTLNNLACYYRRQGKLHSAMTSLKRALELEKRLENVRNAADTQLNMCAVLSQLGKHQEALEHAQEALITLQEGFIHGKHTTTDSDTSSSKLDRISVMCIAYHNVGVEQEFLKDYTESVASYKKGIGLAEQYLGSDHSITTTIRNSYLAAKRTLATKARVKPRSASRDQKNPSKAGSRLLLSPRSGALRMPTPMKDRHSSSQMPTPRSIVADALSRAPLPSPETKSPHGSGKTKKTEPRAAPLSPTDPFFSPRFNFDSNSTEGKPKKLASITTPRSSAAAKDEVKSPPSSKDKRERRKSSVKKPPTTAESDARTTNSSRKERRKTVPTPNEENTGTSVVASQDMNGVASTEDAASRESMTTEISVESAVLTIPTHGDLTAESRDNEKMESIVASRELSQKKNELKLSSRSDLEEKLHGHAQLIDAGPDKQTELNVSADEAIQNLDEEDVTSAISTLLTSIVELVAGQETTLVFSDITCEKDFANATYPPEEVVSVDATNDDHTAGFLRSGRRVELSDENHDEPDASIVVEVEQEESTSDFNGIYNPDERNTEDTTDYDANVTENATEEGYTDIGDEATETNLLSSEDAAILDADKTVDEDKSEELERDVNTTENTSHFEGELKEVAREEAPEMEVEDRAETVLVDEEHDGPLSSTEEIPDAAMDSYYGVLENENYLLEAPANESPLLDGYEAEQTIPNADERDGEYQNHFSNDAEDFASALFKYEDLPAESGGEVYQAAPEHLIPDVGASEYGYEEVYQGAVDTENGPLEPAFLDETGEVISNYELQDHEHVIDSSASTPEQDWNYAEQAESAAVETAFEYGDDALEPQVHSYEEFSYEQVDTTIIYEDYSSEFPAHTLDLSGSTTDVELDVHDPMSAE